MWHFSRSLVFLKKNQNAWFFLFPFILHSSFLFSSQAESNTLSDTLSPNELSYFLYQPRGGVNSSRIGMEMNILTSIDDTSISSLPKDSPLSIRDGESHTAKDIQFTNLRLSPIHKVGSSILFLYALSSDHSLGIDVGVNREQAFLLGNFADSLSSSLKPKYSYSSIHNLFEKNDDYLSEQARAGLFYRGYYLLRPLLKLHLGSSVVFYHSKKPNNLLLYALSDSNFYYPFLEFYLGSHYTFYKNQSLWVKLSYKRTLKTDQSAGLDFRDHFSAQSFYSFITGLESKIHRISLKLYMKGLLVGEGKFSLKRKNDLEINPPEEYPNSYYLQAHEWIVHRRKSAIGSLGLSASFHVSKSFLPFLFCIGLEQNWPMNQTELNLSALFEDREESQEHSLYRLRAKKQANSTLFFKLRTEI